MAAILKIVLYPDERLRKPCEPVTEITPEIRRALDDMAKTMYEAPGIGLAASQVGRNDRIIVIDLGEDEEENTSAKLYKLINPEIIERAGKIDWEEGCLSLPDIRETVRRSAEVFVKALDENGNPVEIEAKGLLAVCLQHEIDHLDGVLFIDHLSRIKRELLKPKLKQLIKDQGR